MRSENDLRQAARNRVTGEFGVSENEIEVDEDAVVSRGDGGCFVAAWIWVPEESEEES